MNKDEAFRALEEKKTALLGLIPADAPSGARRYLTYLVEQEVETAQRHLEAIYRSGLAVGPDMSAVPESVTNPKYAFWLEGVRRHLQLCAQAISGQQAAGG